MNLVLEFLAAERDRLELDRYGIGSRPSFALLTQRTWTSKYVVFVVFGRESAEPALVVKVVRIPGFGDRSLEAEAANLEDVQATRASGYATIPRLVALAAHRGHPLLVQTALAGRALDPGAVRRNRAACVARVVEWLHELPLDGAGTTHDPGWFERLVEVPIRRFVETGPRDQVRAALVERTLDLVEPLRGSRLPLVVEHGDLSHPNLIGLGNGTVGVIDWELAEPRGLPLVDLVFFLTYVAFAEARSSTVGRQVQAFDDAFVGPDAWASRLVTAEAERARVPLSLLTPLLVGCWARYVGKLVDRLEPGPLDIVGRPIPPAPVAMVAIDESIYAALWRHAVDRARDFRWHPTLSGGGRTETPVVAADAAEPRNSRRA